MSPPSTSPAAAGPVSMPRSVVAVGVEEQLRGRLAKLAHGRTIAIGMYTARCCGSAHLIGDLTARFVETPDDGCVSLAPIEGVPLSADERLVELLSTSGPTIVEVGLPFARHLAVDLEDPEAWLDFLATPTAARQSRR